MTDAQDQARALVSCTWGDPCADDHTCISHRTFAAALQAAEAQVWESVAQHLIALADGLTTDRCRDTKAPSLAQERIVRDVAAWCRAQARREEEGRCGVD